MRTAEATGHHDMPVAIDDMTVSIALAELRANHRASDKRQPDLAAMRMAGKGQGNAGGDVFETGRVHGPCE